MAQLYDVDVRTIDYHLKRNFRQGHLRAKFDVVVAKNYLAEHAEAERLGEGVAKAMSR